jgi:hypothetical protein
MPFASQITTSPSMTQEWHFSLPTAAATAGIPIAPIVAVASEQADAKVLL